MSVIALGVLLVAAEPAAIETVRTDWGAVYTRNGKSIGLKVGRDPALGDSSALTLLIYNSTYMRKKYPGAFEYMEALGAKRLKVSGVDLLFRCDEAILGTVTEIEFQREGMSGDFFHTFVTIAVEEALHAQRDTIVVRSWSGLLHDDAVVIVSGEPKLSEPVLHVGDRVLMGLFYEWWVMERFHTYAELQGASELLDPEWYETSPIVSYYIVEDGKLYAVGETRAKAPEKFGLSHIRTLFAKYRKLRGVKQ